MRLRIDQIKNKFEILELRERLLIVAAFLALIYIFFDFFIMYSTEKNIEILKIKEEKISSEISVTSADIETFESKIKSDPNRDLKNELEKLEDRLSKLDDGLKAFSVGLITYENLPIVLHDVLQKNQHLKLVSMETLPSEEIKLGRKVIEEQSLNKQAEALDNDVLSQSIKDTDAARAEANALSSETSSRSTKPVSLFKHGVNLTFIGTYNDVESYIQGLESGRWRFYWDTLSYEVQSYPRAQINLQVYTLSSDRGAFDGS